MLMATHSLWDVWRLKREFSRETAVIKCTNPPLMSLHTQKKQNCSHYLMHTEIVPKYEWNIDKTYKNENINILKDLTAHHCLMI